MGTFAAVLIGLLVVALYLSWTAGRLHRLNARVDAAAATLDGQLLRRSGAATELSRSPRLAADAASELADAAHNALHTERLGHDREEAENRLTKVLQVTVPGLALDPADPVADGLAVAATRVVYARRFHNDAVRDTLALRRRRIPRLFRLSGSAPLPGYFEIDDDISWLPGPYD